MRAKWLAAIESVDYVIIVPFAAAVEAIECVRPNIYCKGREYADAANDVTGNIKRRCGRRAPVWGRSQLYWLRGF